MALTGQFLPSSVSADPGQVSSRSITMSTSAAGAAATYTLKFTPVTTAQELIVDFCANDPLVSDSCTFSAATVPTVSSPSSGGVGTASAVGSGTPVHTIKVVGLTATGGSPITISLSGITNPTTTTSFYARILTYPTSGAQNYAPANTTGSTPTTGAYTDYGGIALSTANNISITSKVFETLSYCVFQTACGTAPDLTLGDSATGALSISNAYVNSNAQYTIATNAGNGAAVWMTGTTLCRTPGTPANCNTGTASVYTITSTGNVAKAISTGSEQFGMCIDTTGGNGGLAPITPYKDTTANNCHTGISTGIYTGSSVFGFNDSTSAGGTNNAAGSQIMQSTGAISTYTGTFAFMGDIAATTEAGLYKTSLNTVATGTF